MNSPSTKNYYSILGIPRTDSLDVIKKAYKKMAVKWHPDKNPQNKQEAKQRFREISQAYQILSEKCRNTEYDGFGSNYHKRKYRAKYNYEDADSLFKNFFKDTGFETKEDQDFFQAFHEKSSQNTKKKYGFNSMFDDKNFWTSGLTSRMGFSNFGSIGKVKSPGKLKKTINTVKQIIDGQTIITKTTNIARADGTEKVIQQKIDQNGNILSHKAYQMEKKDKKTKVVAD